MQDVFCLLKIVMKHFKMIAVFYTQCTILSFHVRSNQIDGFVGAVLPRHVHIQCSKCAVTAELAQIL